MIATLVAVDGDRLVQRGVQLLFAAANEFAGGFDQGDEGRAVHLDQV